MSKVISSSRVVIEGAIIPATIVFSRITGKILDIFKDEVLSEKDLRLRSYDVVSYRNFGSLVIMPGLVDSHVHLNEPGRTPWEGFATGTQSAASGGVTTIVDMPLNSIPPTTTLANFQRKIDAATGQVWVDTAFWGGLVPDNLDDLIPLIRSGVRGFKGFLMDSGVEEFPMVTPAYINKVLAKVQNENTLIMFHAEMAPKPHENEIQAYSQCYNNHNSLAETKTCGDHGNLTCQQAEILSSSPVLQYVEPLAIIDDEMSPLTLVKSTNEALTSVDPRSYDSFLASRPDSFEVNAITHIIDCQKHHPTVPIHIVHLATSHALPIIKEAKFKLGLPLTVETCFHYLTLDADNIPAGATQFKCCPPIRSAANKDKLWKALLDGVITSVVSDHSPCTSDLKRLDEGDFFKAWGGVTSLGLGMIMLWEAGRKYAISLTDIVRWCCENTAQQVGLANSKGHIRVGYDADFAIFDPDVVYRIDNTRTFFKNKLTAFSGKKVHGRVVETILRGNSIYAIGKGVSGMPMGRLILSPRENKP